MSVERDPPRWLDADDCDPALRAMLDQARGSAPVGAHAEALARGIEEAVRTSAAGSGAALHGRSALRWGLGVSGVGVAGVLLYFGATFVWREPAALAPRGAEPAATSPSGAAAGRHPASETAVQRQRPAPELTPPPATTEPQALEHLVPVPEAADSQSARARALRARTSLEPGRARASASARLSATRSASPSREATTPAELADLSEAQGTLEAAAPAQRDVAPELQLLGAAQRALRAAPAKALALAEEHARAYPAGKFAAEREEIAIAALLALGDSERAHARARAFLGRYPRSLSRPRVEHMLEQAR